MENSSRRVSSRASEVCWLRCPCYFANSSCSDGVVRVQRKREERASGRERERENKNATTTRKTREGKRKRELR